MVGPKDKPKRTGAAASEVKNSRQIELELINSFPAALKIVAGVLRAASNLSEEETASGGASVTIVSRGIVATTFPLRSR